MTTTTPSIPRFPTPASASATATVTVPAATVPTAVVTPTKLSTTPSSMLPSPPPPPPPPRPRPRSLHELRLEQIAIWGDAALYSSRSSATLRLSTPSSHSTTASISPQSRRLPHSRTTIGTSFLHPKTSPTTIGTDEISLKPTQNTSTTRRFPDPSPDPIPICHPQSYNYNSNPIPVPASNSSHASAQSQPNTPPSPPRRGSMSLCNSPSADAFHRSGTWAAQAQATLRNARKNLTNSSSNNTSNKNNNTSRAQDSDAHHFFLTRRPSLNSIPLSPKQRTSPGSHAPSKGSPSGRSTPAPQPKARSTRPESRRGGPLARFFSSESRPEKNRRVVESPPPSTSPSSSPSPSSSRSSSPPPTSHTPELRPMHLRERDENDFRMSNAKLPQRDDDHLQHQSDSSHFSNHWNLRARRLPTPTFGRYSRSRMSRLPNPPAASSNAHLKSSHQPRHSHNQPSF